MATQSLIYRSTLAYRSYTRGISNEFTKWIIGLIPRKCMLVSVGLTLLGISIPFLMVLAVIPVTLALGFLGLVLTSVGCVLILYYA